MPDDDDRFSDGTFPTKPVPGQPDPPAIARAEGLHAVEIGRPRDSNPYLRGSLREQWFSGWDLGSLFSPEQKALRARRESRGQR